MIGEELQQFGFKNTDKIAIVVANLIYDDNSQEHVNQNSRWSELKIFREDELRNHISGF